MQDAPYQPYQLIEEGSGRVIVARLELARSVWKQTIGLLGRRQLAADAGMWLEPCNSIHTFGMQFAIDVLFLDSSGRLLRAMDGVKPWRICWTVWKARAIVEIPEGSIALRNIQVGKRYLIEST
jgi:uncharacterized membrane protein (UPF0127 family)